MKKIIISTVILASLLAGVARAEDDRKCTDAAKDTWMTQDAVKEKAKASGLDVRSIEVEGSCYEVKAIDAKGKKIEALFNPATGALVGTEGEGDD